jgi:protein phosphatase
MTVAIRYAVRSDKGLVRGNNEDSVYAGPRLIALADGMGGHAGGEVASRIVISAMEELDEDRQIEDLITALRQAVADANESLAESVSHEPKLDGMGTTLTAMRFSGGMIGLVHVGDSRGYLLRDGELAQITHDDTYVQSLVDAGRLTAEEAMHHPRKSVILRALNGTEVDPDVSIREAIVGDRYLLCSDGLTDVVRPETLREALSEGDAQDCADRLVQLALRGGGPDNVTVVVADVVPIGEGDDVPVAAGAVVDNEGGPVDDESPAARAAGLDAPPSAPMPVAKGRAERRWKRVVVPLVIVVVLAAGALGTWLWTQTQYFVGRSSGYVAVFQGVNTAIGPVHFYSVVERSAVRVDDLTPAARTQVVDGITADSRSDADEIIARLQDASLLPVCSSSSASSSSGGSSTGSTGPSTGAAPSTSRGPGESDAPGTSSAKRTTARSTGTVHVSAPGKPTEPDAPVTTPHSAVTTPSAPTSASTDSAAPSTPAACRTTR